MTHSELLITYVAAESLKPQSRNARTHSRKQIRQIAASIKAFGFNNPILVDGDGNIIAGHGRVVAAKLLEMTRLPTIRLQDMSDSQKRAYILADNKLAESAGWDSELLALELQYITELDVDFDVTLTGFETSEIDLLFENVKSRESDPTDVAPTMDPAIPPVSRVGDLWLLGRHRLLCGDAREAKAYRQLMANELAQMIFVDPPYNVKIDGNVCGLGAVKHPEFLMASGEMSESEFTDFLGTVFGHLVHHSASGSIHYICMDFRHLYEILSAARPIYAEFKNLCVWAKNNGGMGSFYRSQHELILVFKHGNAPHINNFELGQYGRYRTNLWTYAGINSFGPARQEELALHPTVKPVALVADAIKDCSKRGGIVLDSFCGSGTTLIAAEKTGRKAYAMELDPRYVDTALRRFEDYTGVEAVHAETKLSFAEIKAARAESPAPDAPGSESDLQCEKGGRP
jgi:DNA modification methylase